MEQREIGARIRKHREYMGYTREQFAELLGVSPKFCSDIETGVKGMSLQTLCKIAGLLRLSTDYILFGYETSKEHGEPEPILLMLNGCTQQERAYAEELLKSFLKAVNAVSRAADSPNTGKR